MGLERQGNRAPAGRASLTAVVGLAVVLAAALAAQSPEETLRIADRLRRDGDPARALDLLDRAVSAHADRASVHFDRGAVLADLGRYEEAEEALLAGLSLEPSRAEAHLTLAKVLVRDLRFQAALHHVDRFAAMVGEERQGFDGRYVRGLALRRLDRASEAEKEFRRAVEIEPGHADALFNLGAVLARRGAHDEAEAFLRKAAALRPDNPDVRYRLAQLLLQAGKRAEGETEMERFERIRNRAQLDDRVSALKEQAERSMESGDPGRAKESYQRILREDPANAEALTNLGVAYEQLGRGDLAEAMFRKAVSVQPEYLEARLKLGLKLAATGRFPEALPHAAEAVRLDGDRLAARKGLAMVLTRLQRPGEAVPHFERIVRSVPSSAEAHLDLGIALAQSGRREEALAAFQQATRLAPESFLAHYNRGRILHDLDRPAESRAALERAVEIGPSYAPALQLLGTIERAARNDERAVALLRSAAQLDRQNPLAHYDLGLALAQAGSPEDAIPSWERALSLDPRLKDALYNLAQALRDTDPEASRAYFRRFAAMKREEQDTDRAGALWNFALAEAERMRWDKAFALFRQSLEACGDCPAKGRIHKNFGLVYGHSGDYERAAEQLSQALELLPDDEELRQALRVVRSSRSISN